MTHLLPMLSVCVLALAACSDGPESYDDDLTDRQVPARGTKDVLDWIERGFYLDWACEEAPHPARPGSGHSANRICSNAALAGFDGAGSFPLGAAAVKEIFADDGEIKQYAVYRKVTAAAGGDSWYWFEGASGGGDVVANGEGDETCTGCHAGAPQDFVWTVVR